MTVRVTEASPLPSRLPYTDPIRPGDYDWVDVLDTNRYDRTTWFYPWQGTGVYTAEAIKLKQPGQIKARLRMFGTVDLPRAVRTGGPLRAQTFTDLFYGRLQINPAYIDLGNLLNSQTRQVELWNASFAPVTIQQILKSEDDGIDLSLPGAVPFTLAPLQAITIIVGVTTTGPTTIDARFIFDAVQLPDAVLQVVGTRAVVFSLMPDTSKSYLEKMTWVSSVITAHDGTEQRISINEYPDTQLTMTVQQHRDKIHNLDSLLWGWQHRIYALPLWHRAVNVQEAAYASSTTVMCDTTYAGFRVGETAIIWGDYDFFETFEVLEVRSDRLITRRPLQAGWPMGALVAACRSARLPQEVTGSWQHADLASVQLTFVLTEVEQETPFEYGPTYRGSPMLLVPPNWVSPLEERNVRNIEIFESETKNRFTVANSDVPYIVRTQAWFLNSKAKIHQFRCWLYSRRGRVVPFWSPSWKNDMRLAKRIEAGSLSMEIENINYRSLYGSRVGRQDIIIFLRNGQILTKRITNASSGAEGLNSEILSVDTEFPSVIERSAVQMICFLGLHRLDADEVELDWRSDKLALANQNMRLLTDGV